MNNYFSSDFGQPKVVSILKQFIESSQVPHALLFDGPPNVGQHLIAKTFLKELLKKSESKKYDLQIDNLDEPLVKYVIPLPRGSGELPDDPPLKKIKPASVIDDIKSEIKEKAKNSYHEIKIEHANNIKITSIRDIKRYLAINYEEIPYKLVLIEEAHLMGVEAQNALLKSLEEPPNGIIFILISDKPEALLPTIKSRCWNLTFAPLNDAYLKEVLINNFNIEETLANNVVKFSKGSVHHALKLLEFGFDEMIDVAINILRYSMARKYKTAIKLFNDLIDEKSTDVVPLMLTLVINWLSDLQKYNLGRNDLMFATQAETIKKFSAGYKNIPIDEIIFELNNLESLLQKNINLNLLVLNIIFIISSITKKGTKNV